MSPSPGNRQDNRQRGNAAQLLEKYKGMARDAQMQGDRVQSEYFHQFADHYYRILNETRARYEEQRRQRGESYDGDEDEDQDEMSGAPEPRERFASEDSDRNDADDRREARQQGNGEFRGRRPRGRPSDEDIGEDGGERIAADSLPPAIAPSADAGEEPRAPRRRPRRPRDPGEEIAPAA